MVAMVAAALNGTDQTTILILPTVALRGDMIVRLARVGIRPHIWVPGSAKLGPLIIVSAEAACTEGFMTYALRLGDGQKLAQIIIDECQLTVTASSYRQSMSNLAWYVRQVRTQTIWLTATLPPVMQEHFIEHNKLVRPHVVLLCSKVSSSCQTIHLC
jgi:superfamily II DNA helicase RecQ